MAGTQVLKGTKYYSRFKFWGSEIAEGPPEVEYEDVMGSDAGVGEWTRKIVGIPAFSPPATGLCSSALTQEQIA